jgi:hypothetical protein
MCGKLVEGDTVRIRCQVFHALLFDISPNYMMEQINYLKLQFSLFFSKNSQSPNKYSTLKEIVDSPQPYREGYPSCSSPTSKVTALNHHPQIDVPLLNFVGSELLSGGQSPDSPTHCPNTTGPSWKMKVLNWKLMIFSSRDEHKSRETPKESSVTRQLYDFASYLRGVVKSPPQQCESEATDRLMS